MPKASMPNLILVYNSNVGPILCTFKQRLIAAFFLKTVIHLYSCQNSRSSITI